MTDLAKLNELGTVFECHSATIVDFESLFSFLGRKSSIWRRQIQSPNRPNLTYYLLQGQEAPKSILHLPFVTDVLANDFAGVTLVYVQRISDGNEIFFSLLDYCERHGLIQYSPHDRSPRKPFAFLHAKLSDEIKKAIINDVSDNLVKILIATSSAGCGINLPITTFVGWGLDGETSGIIQASGRTARQPSTSEGSVVWVHKPQLHGRRVPASSKVRELLKTDQCLRFVQNNWFDHGQGEASKIKPRPDLCCSNCMRNCVDPTGCEECSRKLMKFSKEAGLDNIIGVETLSEFLKTLNLNESRDETTWLEEKSLAKEILTNFSETKDVAECKQFLDIFSLGEKQSREIAEFLQNTLSVETCEEEDNLEAGLDETSESDLSENDSVDEEYFDSDSEDLVEGRVS